eukprot:scaffold64085_cov18-Tisochrysis_lutea.AAC.1
MSNLHHGPPASLSLRSPTQGNGQELEPHHAQPPFDHSGMQQGCTQLADQQEHAGQSSLQSPFSPTSKPLQSAVGVVSPQAQQDSQQIQRAQRAQGPSERLLHLATVCCCRIQEEIRSSSSSSSSRSMWRAPAPDSEVVGFSPEQGAMLLKGLAALRYRPPPALLFSLMLGGPVYRAPASPVAAPPVGSPVGAPAGLNPLQSAHAPHGNGVMQGEEEDWELISSSSRDGSSSSSTGVPAKGSITGVRLQRNRRPGIPQQLQMLKSAQALLAQPPPAVLQLLEQDFKVGCSGKRCR